MPESDQQLEPAPHDSAEDSADPDAVDLDGLLPTVYDELHALAATVVQRASPREPTRTTSLIQDTYVRLAKRGLRFRDRAHFLRLAARAMRRVLIDRARHTGAIKRGGSNRTYSLDETVALAVDNPDLLALETALVELATFDPRKSRIVELRYFGGLALEEVAELTGLSPATIKREWTLARAWLNREISGGIRPGS